VTSEFGSYREEFSSFLTTQNTEVKVQEDFTDGGATLLELLDDYVLQCQGVIHLVGRSYGSRPKPAECRAILVRYADLGSKLHELAHYLTPDCPFSYAQWEAYLAIYHDVPCFVYVADANSARNPGWIEQPDEALAQSSHLKRMEELGKHKRSLPFTDARDIALHFYKSFFATISGPRGNRSKIHVQTADLEKSILVSNRVPVLLDSAFLVDLLKNQMDRAPFSSPRQLIEGLRVAQHSIKSVLGDEGNLLKRHPIFVRRSIRLVPASMSGDLQEEFIREIQSLRHKPLTVCCPSCWVAPVSVLVSINELFYPRIGQNLLDISVDSTIGSDLIETLEKSNARPDIIIVADGAMRPESAPNIMGDYEYTLPLFRDAITLLRRKAKTVWRLSGARYCSNSAAQECMVLREIPGFNREGRFGFDRASDARYVISQLDHDEGFFDSPLVAHHYAGSEDAEYFVDNEYNSYYYVSMYSRRDLGWTKNQRTAWANIVVAQWMGLQGRTALALSKLRGQVGLSESISRAALGYVQKE
jgi:hypothetical protein